MMDWQKLGFLFSKDLLELPILGGDLRQSCPQRGGIPGMGVGILDRYPDKGKCSTQGSINKMSCSSFSGIRVCSEVTHHQKPKHS